MNYKLPNLSPKQKEEIKHIMENLKVGDEIKICGNVFKDNNENEQTAWTWNKGEYVTLSPELNILHNKSLTFKRKDIKDYSISVKCGTSGEINISWAVLDYDFLYKHYGHYLKTKNTITYKKSSYSGIKGVLHFIKTNKK